MTVGRVDVEIWITPMNDGNVLEAYKHESTSSMTQGVSFPNARWNTMKITSHKESWALGASEINCK